MPPSFRVTGGRSLSGTIRPAGNKNAALPILAATLLADGPCRIDNVPRIRDVETLLALLQHVGAKVQWSGTNTVEVDPTHTEAKPLDPALCKEIRASILLAGPMLARFGPASRIEARISLHSAGSSGFASVCVGSTSTVFVPDHCTFAPTCWSKASNVSTSRMRGTLSMRQGPSARSVAARIGRAAFLLPAGRIVPESERPPVTRNDGGISPPKLRGRLRRRQAFANVGPRASRARTGAAA